MAEIVLTKENFEKEVIASDIPVLVDFWASWCGPCRMIAPFIEQIAKENEGRIKVGKINVDDEPELANRYGIVSIPTVFLFREGTVAAKAVGYQPKDALCRTLGIEQ